MFNKPLKIIPFILPLLLIACSNPPVKTASSATPDNANSASVDDLLGDLQPGTKATQKTKVSAYAAQIRNVIVQKIPPAEAYKGKVCTIRISLQRNGIVDNAIPEAGDEEFCRILISAITQTKLPPAPDDETYQVFKNAHFDFRP